jgi:hypothetical protein
VNDQKTCGQGLAENSTLPAKLGELLDGVSEILEIHMEALALEDNDSRREHEAYRELVKDHRQIANALRRTARQMAGYRTLPMGRHIPEKMAAPTVREAFEKFVKLEQELVTLLEARLQADRGMLREMEGAG